MIRFRNDAGNAYREMAAAIASIVSREEIPKCMEEIAKALNFVIFKEHRKDIRNDFGEEKKQKELWELEKKIADLITDEFITSYEGVIEYLCKQYAKKYFLKIFNQ